VQKGIFDWYNGPDHIRLY